MIMYFLLHSLSSLYVCNLLIQTALIVQDACIVMGKQKSKTIITIVSINLCTSSVLATVMTDYNQLRGIHTMLSLCDDYHLEPGARAQLQIVLGPPSQPLPLHITISHYHYYYCYCYCYIALSTAISKLLSRKCRLRDLPSAPHNDRCKENRTPCVDLTYRYRPISCLLCNSVSLFCFVLFHIVFFSSADSLRCLL